MYIIVGLGNPGKQYENTRHNMGFLAVDLLAEKYNIDVNKIKFKALVGEGRIAGQKVLLVKPQTYMNLSGEAVRQAMDFYKIDPEEDMLIIYDDISLAPGNIRIRKKGSAGGHNGLTNINELIGTQEYARIRVGIGNEFGRGQQVDYVLGALSKEEMEEMPSVCKRVIDGVKAWATIGPDRAMNTVNTKPQKQ